MAVYFIHDALSNMVKIGWADEPWRRMCQMQTGCPGDLTLLALEPGFPEREFELHRQFAQDRARGEWFRHSETLANYIVALGPPARPRTYKTPKAEMIARLREATGAAFQTCDAWVERGSIPGPYWKAIAEAGIYSLEELADRHAALRNAAPYVRKYPQRQVA